MKHMLTQNKLQSLFFQNIFWSTVNLSNECLAMSVGVRRELIYQWHTHKKKKEIKRRAESLFARLFQRFNTDDQNPLWSTRVEIETPVRGHLTRDVASSPAFAPLLTCGRRSYGCKLLSADAWLSQPVWDRRKTLRRLLRLRLHTVISSGPLYLTSLCPWRDLAGPKAILLPRLSVVWHLNPGALCA